MDGNGTLYCNATIHTMSDTGSTAEAMLVRDGSIAAVGSLSDVENGALAGDRRVNLEGQAVVPGFNDCHAHILGFGLDLEQIDVSVDAVRTIADIARAVRARSAEMPAGEWVLGRGYDQNMLAEHRHPTRRDLDEAVPDHPLVLWHTSGHVLTCNSKALERAEITAGSENPAGGEIERDEHGEPTGLLKESAMELMGRIIPPPGTEESSEAILRAMEVMASFGITSATDAATGHGASIDPELEAYRRAASSGRLAGRITLLPQIGYVAPPHGDDVRSRDEFDAGDAPEWLAISGTKIFSDGALSTRTAAMRRPYAEDATNRGILLWEQPVLESMMRRAHGAGWQIATHALGDRAVEAVLDAYQGAMSGQERQGHRHRIEHCMVCDEGLGRRIKNLAIVPVLQPDIHRLGDGYITALGVERAQDVIPMRVFEHLNIPVAFSSDCPVIPCNPLEVIRSAVVRRTPGGIVLGRHHAVSVMHGIRLYTAGSAYATHTDTIKGTLRPGLLADFVVLSRDPAATTIDDFDDLTVTRTVVGGEIRFQS
jgi:predicted amidohydrolase YtcJ